jgi:undecaprenyl-diphosphatase
MNEYLQIAILALVQGAAELLPVSSSAHVIVAAHLLGYNPSPKEMAFLLVMLHTGTMFAVLVYFWRRWMALVFPPASMGQGTRLHFPKMVVLATAISGVLGLAALVVFKVLGYEPEDVFKNLLLIGISLFLVGLFIIAAGSLKARTTTVNLGTRSASLIGLVQGLVLPFRGFSRSGATISTGLCCGLSRRIAEDFSFALAVLITPPLQVYTLYKLLKETNWHLGPELVELIRPGLMGMVFSFLAGLVALKFLSQVLEHGRWKYFGYYCLAAAAVVLVVHFGS